MELKNTHIYIETKKQREYWKDLKHCREFFDAFAKDKGFDPLNADSWYPIYLEELNSRSVPCPFSVLI